jgi:hypothetical protein
LGIEAEGISLAGENVGLTWWNEIVLQRETVIVAEEAAETDGPTTLPAEQLAAPGRAFEPGDQHEIIVVVETVIGVHAIEYAERPGDPFFEGVAPPLGAQLSFRQESIPGEAELDALKRGGILPFFKPEGGKELAGFDAGKVIPVPVEPAIGELRAQAGGFAERTGKIQFDLEIKIFEEPAEGFDSSTPDIEPIVVRSPAGVALIAEIGLSLDEAADSEFVDRAGRFHVDIGDPEFLAERFVFLEKVAQFKFQSVQAFLEIGRARVGLGVRETGEQQGCGKPANAAKPSQVQPRPPGRRHRGRCPGGVRMIVNGVCIHFITVRSRIRTRIGRLKGMREGVNVRVAFSNSS